MNFARFSPVLVLASALVTSMMVSSELQAGASNKNGSPYGNGSFFPDSGSFSSIVRGSNGFIGTVEFATSTTNTSTNATTNSGIATIYASGQQFVGSAYGAIEPASGTIAVTYFANTAGQIVALPTVTYNAEVFTSLSNTALTYTVYLPSFGITNFSVSNNVSGQFSATLQNSYPNQTFSGTGEANAYIQAVNAIPVTNGAATNIGLTYEYLVTETNLSYDTSVVGSRVNENN